MAQSDEQEKTEEPTEHKIEEAREEGNVPISTEISSVMLMVIALIVFMQAGGWMYHHIRFLFNYFYSAAGHGFSNQFSAMQYLSVATKHAMLVMMPVLTGLFVMAVLVNVGQTGMAIAPKAISPKFERMSPIKGIKNIFSMKSIVELVKGVSKILIIGVIIYFTLLSEIDDIVSFLILPLSQILSQSGQYIFLVVKRILVALVILSIMDAAYTHYQYRKDLRMSKKEVKDEMKQMEGDPEMKQKRKEKSQEMSQQRLDHSVLASDAVVTNPTHYAVALHYDPEESEAPIIRAKGMRNRAKKIKEFARHYEVPIVENPPVARALYASAEEGEFVPPELYKAVAEVLAYVYKLNNKGFKA